ASRRWTRNVNGKSRARVARRLMLAEQLTNSHGRKLRPLAARVARQPTPRELLTSLHRKKRAQPVAREVAPAGAMPAPAGATPGRIVPDPSRLLKIFITGLAVLASSD